MEKQKKPTKETLTQVLEYLASNGVEFSTIVPMTGNIHVTPKDILAIHNSTEDWRTTLFCSHFDTTPEVMKEWFSQLTFNDEVHYPCCELNEKGLPCRKGAYHPKRRGIKGNCEPRGFEQWRDNQRNHKYCWFHANQIGE